MSEQASSAQAAQREPSRSLSSATFCRRLDPSQQSSSPCSRVSERKRDVDLLCVACLTSAKAAASSFLGSSCAGAAAGWAAGAVPLVAGVASLLTGSGAVAGAGAAGVVSVGFVVLAVGCSVVAVGADSSFFAFFLLKRLLKAFFTWSIASGAVCLMSALCRPKVC